MSHDIDKTSCSPAFCHACHAKPEVGTDHSDQFCSFNEGPLNMFSGKRRFPKSCTKAEFLSRISRDTGYLSGYILICISKGAMWAICRVDSFYIFHLIEVKFSVVWFFYETLCFKRFIAYSINLLNYFGFCDFQDPLI